MSGSSYPRRPRLAELVEAGALTEVRVAGWSARAYARPNLAVPRRAAARTLLSPFDPLVWERSRVRRLFGMDLVLELYTPAPRRRFGYYVLPFLLGDRLAARVDLKADRQRRVLRVAAAWYEPPLEPAIPGPRRPADTDPDGAAAGGPSVAPPVGDPAAGDPAAGDVAGVARELAAELGELAHWLALDGIEVAPVGTLASPLAHAIVEATAG
ncbi:DNA glycosylase AlkZ-like family protein [Frankia sp. AgKG'84/4]